MKHVVTLTTSNPAHEHVSLRRRQSTTNFMVEAADEQTAILRATAHFRRLGHYIHEAKIFKKKDQLNELAPLALVPVALGAAGRLALPYAARFLAGQAARRGIFQGGKTSLGKLTRDEVLAQGAGLGASAIANKLLPSSDEGDKETNLGSVVSGGLGSAIGGRLGFVGKVAGATAARTTAVRDAADDVAQAAIQKAAAASKSVGDAANDVVAAAIQRARALVPGKIEVPPSRPDVELEPAISPQRVKPEVKPDVEVKPEAQIAPKVKPETVVGKAEVDPRAKAEPQAKAEVEPKPKTDSPPKTKTSVEPRPKSRVRSPFFLPSLGDRPDVDPGTLGQYRGLFPLYQFSDFRSMQESAPMNAIGRVLAKRKKNDKENAEGEKNKINMEPKLGGKA